MTTESLSGNILCLPCNILTLKITMKYKIKCFNSFKPL